MVEINGFAHTSGETMWGYIVLLAPTNKKSETEWFFMVLPAINLKSRHSTSKNRELTTNRSENAVEPEFSVIQLWPSLPVITGYFYGMIHSISGLFLVLITNSHGQSCLNQEK